MSVSAVTVQTGLPPVRIQDLARRLAVEMDAAAALCEVCQWALGQVVERGLTEEALVRLQGFDELGQTLAEFARLFDRLGLADGLGAAPGGLLEPIRLAALRSRLEGADAVERQADDGVELW